MFKMSLGQAQSLKSCIMKINDYNPRMKNFYAFPNPNICGQLLDGADWSVFWDAKMQSAVERVEDSSMPPRILESFLAVTQKAEWSGQFRNPQWKNFILFEKTQNGEALVGMVQISVSEEKTTIEDMQIFQPYRDQGYSRYLYDMAYRYALDHAPHDFIEGHITDSNRQSIRSAEKNGLVRDMNSEFYNSTTYVGNLQSIAKTREFLAQETTGFSPPQQNSFE